MHYTVEALDLDAHLYRITLHLAPTAEPVVLKLPVWIPGSYLVREFSRHVVRLSAHAGDARRSVPVQQVAKNAWRVAPSRQPVTVRYEVYACDLSVRTAWLDADRGFFNGTSLFLYTDAARGAPCSVEIRPPEDPRARGWQLATTLARRGKARQGGFGTFTASGYDELIDKPVTMGRLQTLRFDAHGTPHEIVVTGAPAFDGERLAADVRRICEAQIALFDPAGRSAPFERYLFMLHASGDGYGGLEHRDSTALIARRADLPQPGDGTPPRDGYVTLLGLFSHEYFHAWNVKRIRPRAFEPYDLERENPTRLLWLFEGFTSYYDDLMLLRAGLIDEARYFKLLARAITSVFITPGRQVESAADASFNAWLKYYRPDENTPNSTISYYLKGALIALALDLQLRRRSKRTLDDLMRHLWQRHLRGEPGIGEDELPALIRQLGGGDLRAFFRDVVHGTADPPLAPLLAHAGVRLREVADTQPAFGGKWDARDDGVLVGLALSGGALQRAGLARGDLIVAVNGEQANRARWESLKATLKAGVPARLHYFRDGLLRETTLTPRPPAVKEWVLERPAAARRAAQRKPWPAA
jgi:predicted metalloprotease with PDZ domain